MVWSRIAPERPPSTTATMCRSAVRLVVILVCGPAIVEHTRLEIRVVAREAVLDRAGKDREVARRRHLFGIGQPRWIPIDRPTHPEFPGPAGHHLREGLDGPGNVLRHDDGDVVCRLGYQRL